MKNKSQSSINTTFSLQLVENAAYPCFTIFSSAPYLINNHKTNKQLICLSYAKNTHTLKSSYIKTLTVSDVSSQCGAVAAPNRGQSVSDMLTPLIDKPAKSACLYITAKLWKYREKKHNHSTTAAEQINYNHKAIHVLKVPKWPWWYSVCWTSCLKIDCSCSIVCIISNNVLVTGAD